MPAFSWKPIESADYKTYIANLRSLSFPEELIRELIIADVDKLYAPREDPLQWKSASYDTPLSQRRRDPTLENIENFVKLRQIKEEKQNVLDQLLGTRIPREILRTPNARNYEGYDDAIRRLPPEKQEAVMRVQEDVFIENDLLLARARSSGSGFNLDDYRRLNDKFDAQFRQILAPEEYERYMMNTTPAGTEMARRAIGMEPTDEEMLRMWQPTLENWKDTGGVYGRWRAEHISSAKIAAEDEKMAASLREVLGDDRYMDYQMAVSETGQQMRNLAARYEIPRETLTRAFALQSEIDGFGKSLGGNSRSRETTGQIGPEAARIADLQRQLSDTLGPEILKAWNSGRRLSYDLQPD
jgi:hypothetical protein